MPALSQRTQVSDRNYPKINSPFFILHQCYFFNVLLWNNVNLSPRSTVLSLLFYRYIFLTCYFAMMSRFQESCTILQRIPINTHSHSLVVNKCVYLYTTQLTHLLCGFSATRSPQCCPDTAAASWGGGRFNSHCSWASYERPDAGRSVGGVASGPADGEPGRPGAGAAQPRHPLQAAGEGHGRPWTA